MMTTHTSDATLGKVHFYDPFVIIHHKNNTHVYFSLDYLHKYFFRDLLN